MTALDDTTDTESRMRRMAQQDCPTWCRGTFHSEDRGDVEYHSRTVAEWQQGTVAATKPLGQGTGWPRVQVTIYDEGSNRIDMTPADARAAAAAMIRAADLVDGNP